MGLRRRLPLVGLVAVCVTTVTVAVSGAADPTGGIRFAQSGHWIGNAVAGLVFHIDGASKSVDATAAVPGIEPDSQVVQGDTSGFVLGGSRITEFGKSDLSVERTFTPPTGERPSLVETDGGPYLVYQEAGQVVRLGGEFETIPAGEALGSPVATPDGTLWLQQRNSGRLCKLPKAVSQLVCPISLPDRHTGALTIVGERAVFVDTTADTLLPVDADALGEPVKMNVDVSPAAKIAPAAADGRVAMLDQAAHSMVFVDAGGSGAQPVTVLLPEGEYASPSASESSVVVLNLTRGQVLTYGPDGSPRQQMQVPQEAGDPRLVRGDDDRVYVDGGEAKHVLVIDPAGTVSQVPLPVPGASKPADTVTPPQTQQPPPPVTQQPPPKSQQPPAKPDPLPDVRSQAPPKQTPPKQPPQPPVPPVEKPIPASPPGAVGNLDAQLNGANAVVTWDAATPNGAAITAYRVSWKPSSGAGGSATTAAGTRTRTITGLTAGATYTITVVAENSAGRGAAATTTVTRPVTRTLTLSRGPSYSGDPDQCDPSSCAWMHIKLSGFTPGTWVDLMPHSSNSKYENPGHGQDIGPDGTASLDAFYYPGVGDTVWVTTKDGSVKSNEFTWSAG